MAVSNRSERPDGRHIGTCPNGHSFVGVRCPICLSWPERFIEYRLGDCVSCGAFCGAQAYCCDAPDPIVFE